MKKCNKCQRILEVTEFQKKKGVKSGLTARCKSCLSVDKKNSYANNRTEVLKQVKTYADNNKDKVRTQKSIYYSKNREDIIANKNEYAKNRRKIDPMYRLKSNLRTRIKNSIVFQKGFSKSKSTEEILGVSFETVKSHLQRQFKKGMTWENHGFGEGKWNIDHIIPLSSAKTEEQMIKLCHYTNLQPLWHKENRYKSDKIIPTQLNIGL